MKQALSHLDEVAAAVKGGFHSTQNAVLDFIREADFIARAFLDRVTSS
jgi:hypothetical protein